MVSTIGSFLLNPECELNMPVLEIFYTKVIAWAFMPIFVTLSTYICWRVWAWVVRKDWKKEEPSEPVTLFEEESIMNIASAAGGGGGPGQRGHRSQVSNWSDLSKWEKDAKRKTIAAKLRSNTASERKNAAEAEAKELGGWLRVPCEEEQVEYVGAPRFYFFQSKTNVSQWEPPEAWLGEMKIIEAEQQRSVAAEQNGKESSTQPSLLEQTKTQRARKKNPLAQRKPTPKDNFVVCLVILLHLIYPTACQNTFRLLACTEVGGEWYLQADLEQLCWNGSHVTMFVLVCLPQILLYVIGFPLASALMLFKNRHRLHNARTKYRWGEFDFFTLFLFFSSSCVLTFSFADCCTAHSFVFLSFLQACCTLDSRNQDITGKLLCAREKL